MSKTPGTVSKILWHFTGGPIWNTQSQKQSCERKSDDDAYKALIGILQSQVLNSSNYDEVIHGLVSRKFVEKTSTSKQTTHTKNRYPLSQGKICCVADIPIQHLQYHSERYGHFALGFRRESIVKAGFNPVLYSLEDSPLVQNVFTVSDSLNTDVQDRVLEQLDQLIFDYPNLDDFKEEIRRLVLGAISEVSWDAVETSAVYFGRLAAFIKTFTPNEFDSIYCEREWRLPDSFRFATRDLAMIVLPRSHIEKFFADLDLFPEDKRLPRNIPIVPWEDLIEH